MSARSIERVALVFPGALGDLCLALPTLRALRARHPRAHVIGVVSEGLRPLVRLAGIVDADASLDAADTAGLFGGERQPAWLDGVQTVYAWLGDATAEIAARLGASIRVEGLRIERGAGPRHAAITYARAIGWETDIVTLGQAARIAVPPSPRVERLLEQAGGPPLVIHRGAGSPRKCWQSDGFGEVARWWLEHRGPVVDLQGPAEAGLARLAGVPIVCDWGLCDVVALLARSAGYLGHDTGPSHLAAAAAACGVAIFGPTAVARWRPLGATVSTIDVPSPANDGISIDALAPARVITRLARLPATRTLTM